MQRSAAFRRAIACPSAFGWRRKGVRGPLSHHRPGLREADVDDGGLAANDELRGELEDMNRRALLDEHAASLHAGRPDGRPQQQGPEAVGWRCSGLLMDQARPTAATPSRGRSRFNLSA